MHKYRIYLSLVQLLNRFPSNVPLRHGARKRPARNDHDHARGRDAFMDVPPHVEWTHAPNDLARELLRVRLDFHAGLDEQHRAGTAGPDDDALGDERCAA